MNLSATPIENLRAAAPLIHFISNYVTASDCANITLACGGLPIMSDEIQETVQIVSRCSALVINTGTINTGTLPCMLHAGQHANKSNIPVLLDPVGVGLSDFRNDALELLLKEISCTAVTGNISEMKCLYSILTNTYGADPQQNDYINEENEQDTVFLAKKLSVLTGAVITIIGSNPIIANQDTGFAVYNGHGLLSKIAGSRCMTGAVSACFLAGSKASPLEALLAGTASLGICGELALEHLLPPADGSNMIRYQLIDEMSRLTDETLRTHIKLQHIL